MGRRSPDPLTLVVGEEELLVERAIDEVISAARSRAPDAEVQAETAAVLAAHDVTMLLSPSLFGAARVVVLRDMQDGAPQILDALLDGLRSVEDEISVVVTHAGGAKGRSALDRLASAGAAVVRCGRLTRPSERADFVAAEVRRAGRQITADGVAALIDSVGTDLRELATACDQLIADTTGPIDAAAVARYHRGRADATGFAIADRAVEGDVAGALEVLRWAQATALPPVLVTSALAADLRLIARVASAGRGSSAAVARTLGLPAWKVDKATRWARGWTPAALAAALRAVALADGEVKGAAADAGYATERAVLAVAQARSR